VRGIKHVSYFGQKYSFAVAAKGIKRRCEGGPIRALVAHFVSARRGERRGGGGGGGGGGG